MKDNEDEPYFTVQHNGETVYCDRYNTMANTYLGELAIYNHVYIDLDPEDDDAGALYIFKGGEGYDKVISFIVKNKLMALINQYYVEEPVKETYIKSITDDLNNTKGVPPEWT